MRNYNARPIVSRPNLVVQMETNVSISTEPGLNSLETSSDIYNNDNYTHIGLDPDLSISLGILNDPPKFSNTPNVTTVEPGNTKSSNLRYVEKEEGKASFTVLELDPYLVGELTGSTNITRVGDNKELLINFGGACPAPSKSIEFFIQNTACGTVAADSPVIGDTRLDVFGWRYLVITLYQCNLTSGLDLEADPKALVKVPLEFDITDVLSYPLGKKRGNLYFAN